MHDYTESSMRLTKITEDKVIYPISLTHIKEDTFGRDMLFGGRTVCEHEIYICIEGEAVSYVGDASYSIQGGTVLTYKPEEHHRTFVTSTQQYDRYILLFHYDLFANLWQDADHAILCMFSQREAYEKNAIRLLPKEFGQLKFLLERAVQYEEGDTAQQAAFLVDFIKIMQLLSVGFANTKGHNYIGTRVPVVDMALEIIDKQYCQLQRVDEISKKLNVSDSYLARTFKKQVGTSVYDYILNMKFAHAVRLLSAGSSVTDACFESGFNSYSHFIQMFKRRYGTTPRKYQKNLDV